MYRKGRFRQGVLSLRRANGYEGGGKGGNEEGRKLEGSDVFQPDVGSAAETEDAESFKPSRRLLPPLHLPPGSNVLRALRFPPRLPFCPMLGFMIGIRKESLCSLLVSMPTSEEGVGQKWSVRRDRMRSG